MVRLPADADRPPDQVAHDESIALPISDLVTRLREILGVRLVAYIGGVRSTRVVSSWVEHGSDPEPTAEERLRQAYHAAKLLTDQYDAITVQSWFKGMNPSLGDQSPARKLRDGRPEHEGKNVIAAALSFAYIG